MRLYYVAVNGPYDGTFVGPFPAKTDAATWAEHMELLKGDVFSFYAMSDLEVRENQAAFPGAREMPFVTPPAWEHDNVIQA